MPLPLRTSELKNCKSIVKWWIKETTENNQDKVIILYGKEGVGKSSLALILAEMIMTEQGKEFNLKEQMHFDFKSWKKATVNAEPGTVQIIDEAGKFLLSRRAMDAETVNALEFVTECRKFNGIHLICIPSINYIDKYFREERVSSAFCVTSKGWVTIYPRQYASKLSDHKSRQWVYARYTTRMRDKFRSYDKIFGKKKWDAYEVYCKDNMKEDTEPEVVKKYRSPKQIRDMFSVSNDWLIKRLNAGDIESIRLPSGHNRYEISSVKTYLQGGSAITHNEK